MRYYKRNKIFTVILIIASVFIYTNYTRIIEPNPNINKKSELYINDIYMSDGKIYNNYLSKNEKKAYKTLLETIKQRKTSKKIKKQDNETIESIISDYRVANQAIWVEHPELISYAYYSYRYKENSDYIEIFPIYAINNQLEEEINTLLIERKIDKIKKATKKKEVEEKYIEQVRLNIMELDAWDPAYDGTIRLLKPIKAQGTLENKIILAQFVALFQTMDYFKGGATRFSFVVDSPRAKEASVASSKEILKMISQMKMLPQIILATIDYSEYKSELDTPAKIIVLKEKRKLLNSEDYTRNEEYISTMAELLKNVPN